MKTHGVNVDLNNQSIGGNRRIVDQSEHRSDSGDGCWLRSATLVTLVLSVSGCSYFGGGEQTTDFNSRIYVGAGGLVSNLDPDTDEVPGVSVDESSSAGGSIALGYDLSPRLSIEGHLADLGEADLDPNGSIGYQVGGISAIVYGLNDERDRARREGFSVYGRLGLGALGNQADEVPFERLNDFHLLAGVGLEYGLDNGLGFRAELVAHDTDAQYGQFGLVYRFGDTGSRAASKSNQSAEPDSATTSVPVPAPTNSVVDSDSDGVVDSRDKCLGTASGLPVDNTGCEIFGGVIEGVNFRSGSDALTDEAKTVLDSVAGTLSRYRGVVVSIDAHTDNQGSATGNLDLSKKRAVSVARYLASKGVNGRQLKPRAFGESRPRVSNATAAGRRQNRRVEFNVVGN